MKNKNRDTIRAAIANLRADNEWGKRNAVALLQGMLEPPQPKSYAKNLAAELSEKHSTTVAALTEREPTVSQFLSAVTDMRVAKAPDERPEYEDMEFFIELDRAVIGEIDNAIRIGFNDDPTSVLRSYLRPVAVRLEQGDVILHITNVELADEYEAPTPPPF
ncbi:MAG: hypothetical protein JWO15_3928 [Sphingomonadales bacterium]|nr:hypothetical protein [Sphingomonadales bacterium]